jgi:hypothetical protein
MRDSGNWSSDGRVLDVSRGETSVRKGKNAVRSSIALSQWFKTKVLLDARGDGGVIIHTMVDDVFWYQRRDNDGRNPNPYCSNVNPNLLWPVPSVVSPGARVEGGTAWSKKPPCSSQVIVSRLFGQTGELRITS